MKKLLVASLVILSSLSAQAELCDKDDIMGVCASVSDSKSALDCYKGAKGKYAGVHCEKECKEKLLYCVDNEKVSLKNVFDN